MPEEKPPPEGTLDDANEKQMTRRFDAMLVISDLVGSVMEIDSILQTITGVAADLFDAPVCSVYLLGPQRENLTLRATVGHDLEAHEYISMPQLPIGRGLPGIAAETNELIAVADAAEDPRHETIFGEDDRQHHHSYICAPLRIQDEVIGVMTARRNRTEPFSNTDCTLFTTICKQVSIVIEKSRMYREKRESDRLAAISISLSEVAHYIKNLLQNMKGGMYFVEVGLNRGDLDAARKGWEVLQRGNQKIASLVENMLNYSRSMELHLEEHNINSVIYELLHQIDDSAIERGVALMPETEHNLPPLKMDCDKIEDALLNLIGNAIDAIPPTQEDGLVMVRSRWNREKNSIMIEVEDNGAGIPKDVQEKIFNLFFSTKGQAGSGIGLSVTRKIIERHGGEIDLWSEEGEGTKFTVRLPIDPEEDLVD